MKHEDLKSNSHGRATLQGLISAVSFYLSFLGGNTLTALLPSFFTHQSKLTYKPKPSATSNISTLDGLRGLSCLVVLHTHWTSTISDSYQGITGAKNTEYFLHRPFIHLLWHGSAQVYIFFVLSGYVLSLKCLKQIHAQQFDGVYKTLASSAFRRGIRIFLPPIASIVICTILTRLGAYDYAVGLKDMVNNTKPWKLLMMSIPPHHCPTFKEQMKFMFGAILDLVDLSPRVFDARFPRSASRWQFMDDHLWTIPQEYYGSMKVFMALLATSRLTCGPRLFIHVMLVVLCWGIIHNLSALFFAGMTIAEFDLLWKKRQDRKLAGWNPALTASKEGLSYRWKTSSQKLLSSSVIRAFILILGLYLISAPRAAAESTHGYMTIFSWLPSYMPINDRHNFLRSMSAVIVVWSISNISTETPPEDFEHQPWWSSYRGWVVASLANPVSHYLGKISFSMYIVHGPILSSIGYAILPIVYQLAIPDPARRVALSGKQSTEELTSMEFGSIWLLGYIVILPICIWVSDIFTRCVDDKCVSLGRIVEGWFLSDSDKSATPLPSSDTFGHRSTPPE